MKIFVGDNGNIDFDGPIEATDEQIEKIISFFKSIYRPEVVEVDIESGFRSERIGEKLFQKTWSVAEYAALLDLDKDTEELSEELGRTWMSVDIQRGQWIPRFQNWTKRNNKNFIKGDIKKIVKEFIDYLDKQKLLKKEQRKEEDIKKKRLLKEKKRLEKKLQSHKLLKRTRPSEDIEKAIEDTISKIEEVEAELNKYDFSDDN
jgi:Rps23 Pro-64 3,4-dihydroxylase Tpa1-like proline 4-hydroxylase